MFFYVKQSSILYQHLPLKMTDVHIADTMARIKRHEQSIRVKFLALFIVFLKPPKDFTSKTKIFNKDNMCSDTRTRAS